MKFRFDKLLIGLVVAALLIACGAFFGSRWFHRDLPGDASKPSTPPTIDIDSLVNSDDGDTVLTPNSSDRSNSDDPSEDSSAPSDQSDQITADLEEASVRMNEWCDNLLNQFPDVAAVKASVEGFQEVLRQVTARNQQLKEEGVPIEARKRQLARFAEEIAKDSAMQTRIDELHMQWMREDTESKLKFDRYINHNMVLPLPPYLIGMTEEQWRSMKHLAH